MYKRIVLSLFFTVLLVLPTFSFAQDTPKVVPGLGTLVIPSGIEVIPSSTNTSNMNSDTLLIKENGKWYSAQLIICPFQEIPQQPLENILYSLNAILDGIIKDQIAQYPNSKILHDTFLKASVTNNQTSLTKTTIMFLDSLVVHTDFYILQGTNYPIMIVVTSSDAESDYWKTIVFQILNNIKR